jgi:hypothetical protein
MKAHRIESFATLHELLSTYRKDKRWAFRGHSDIDWKLVPKAGREPYALVKDSDYFEAWKRRAVEYAKGSHDDWDWLAIAQHHGLATRLLDWTMNPLNAAYFAVREAKKSDAVVYAAIFRNRAPSGTSPMTTKGVARFLPRGVVPRITRQGGLFSVHGDPQKPLTEQPESLDGFEKITIPESYRQCLLEELSYYGINDATMFPDLDGLSKFVNWGVESGEYFQK